MVYNTAIYFLPHATTESSPAFLLEKGDVAVSPGSGFGEAGEGFLRMALVENENRLRQAVRQIGRCLDREAKSLAASEGPSGNPVSTAK